MLAGDALSDGASFIPIAAVDASAGTGTLEFAWPGTTRSGYAVWWIWRNPARRQSAQYAAAQASKVSARQAQITGQAVVWRVATETNTPWIDPEEGDRYLIGASPTGAWAGKAGYVVERRNGADVFSQASVGDCAAIQDTNVVKLYGGSSWASTTADISGSIDWEAAVDIASATTTDIGAADSNLVRITGTTTITGLGTAAVGTARWVLFSGALTLTHNATSLILPYGASIATGAGSTALFVSEGSGNWRCYWYQASTSASARTILGALAKAGDTILGALGLAATAPVASAATADIGAQNTNVVEITGTTTITSFGTAAANVWRLVRFAGALTLTHNATSLILPYGANIVTSAGDTMLAVSEGSGNWRVHSYQFTTTASARSALGVRDVLMAARTYYVRTDGSDSNTGLANTSGGAFLTIQKAVDTVASLDISIYAVTISVADGTYTAAVALKSLVGSGAVTIQGNTGTPSNVLISTTSVSAVSVDGVRGTWLLNGMKIQTATSGHGISMSANSSLSISNVNFGACANSHIRVDGAAITILTGYTIDGGAQRHWLAQRGGRIFKSGSITVTLTGTPAFSTAFADSQLVSLMQVNGITFSGSATGARYSVTLNAVIDTIGGGASYLPGDSAGSAATGGQYA
ncbi:MAG: DUF2793 domain-containing protein [Albidovulum sp.]